LFNFECSQNFSSNGQIWLPKKSNITRFLTGLEIQISMKTSETENRFETGFQQPKTGLKLVFNSQNQVC